MPSLVVAAWLGSGVAVAQAPAGAQPYEAQPGDAVQYRVHRHGDDEPTTCWRAFAGKIGGQITVQATCDNGFRGTNVTDLAGGLVREETKTATYEYKPHNFQFPAEALRVGLSWNGTYQISKNGKPHGWISKNCTATAADTVKLRGFRETLTAYSVECSFGRTSDSRLGAIHYAIAYLGSSWPIAVKTARSRAIKFKPAAQPASAQR